jgi:diguanylate cyclase (GGDEF)-like protein
MALILIVEDDIEMNSLMSLTLRLENYEVLQAHNGAQAIQLAIENVPDLILTDVMMPGMTGHEIAHTLRDNPATANIPIIFVTAKQELEDRLQGLELAVDYICKPFATPELMARVRAALRMRKMEKDLRAVNEQLARLAITDELTGLCNRRGFDTEMEDELWRSRRFGYALAVMIFDLDRFKSINDTYGHPQGDAVLKAFAEVLRNSSRRIDKVARFGGEEFVALLPATDAIGASTFAEKVRTSTAALRIPVEDGSSPPIHITVSGGGAVALAVDQTDASIAEVAQDLLQAADRCLYQAKAAGRDQIVVQVVEEFSRKRPAGGAGPAHEYVTNLAQAV